MNYRDLVASMRGASPVQEASDYNQAPPVEGFNNGPYFHPDQIRQLQQLQEQLKLSPLQMKQLIDQVMKGG